MNSNRACPPVLVLDSPDAVAPTSSAGFAGRPQLWSAEGREIVMRGVPLCEFIGERTSAMSKSR